MDKTTKKIQDEFKQIVSNRPGLRPRTRTFSLINMINIILMIFVVIMKINLVFTLETNADFKFCDTNERKMINIESTCSNDISKNKEIEILNLKN